MPTSLPGSPTHIVRLLDRFVSPPRWVNNGLPPCRRCGTGAPRWPVSGGFEGDIRRQVGHRRCERARRTGGGGPLPVLDREFDLVELRNRQPHRHSSADGQRGAASTNESIVAGEFPVLNERQRSELRLCDRRTGGDHHGEHIGTSAGDGFGIYSAGGS
jgi:hypothetical protein